jgi:integrase/recombinase XerC
MKRAAKAALGRNASPRWERSAGPIADAQERVGDIAGCAQLRQASPRRLRHTFAKSALLTGPDVRHVAALLGHRDLATTMV